MNIACKKELAEAIENLTNSQRRIELRLEEQLRSVKQSANPVFHLKKFLSARKKTPELLFDSLLDESLNTASGVVQKTIRFKRSGYFFGMLNELIGRRVHRFILQKKPVAKAAGIAISKAILK